MFFIRRVILKYFALMFVISVSVSVASQKPKLVVGSVVPTFMLKNMEGKWIKLKNYCGKNSFRHTNKCCVIVSFWATYCEPCKKEIPELERLVSCYKDSVKLFLVSIDKQGKSIVSPVVKEHGFKSEVLLDNYQRTAKRYGVKALPTLFLIDRKGIVRYVSYGYDKDVGLKPLEQILHKRFSKKKILDTLRNEN